jgi:hypothetical protein
MLFWYVQQSGGKDSLSAVKFKEITETDVSNCLQRDERIACGFGRAREALRVIPDKARQERNELDRVSATIRDF